MQIFISYRREDSEAYAGRIYDDLRDRFGEDHVFMDVDTIELGVDFVEVIQAAVSSCDVLIAVIGRRWLDVVDEHGQRRVENPEDFVRLEIATALERNIRVIPVLVQGMTMPSPNRLPEALRRLTRRNAVELRHGSWRSDVQRLIAALEKPPRGSPAPPVLSQDTESSDPGVVHESQRPQPRPSRSAISTSRQLRIVGIAAVLLIVLVAGAEALRTLNTLGGGGFVGDTISPAASAQLAASAAPNDQLAVFLSTVTAVAGRQQTAQAQRNMTATALGATQTAQTAERRTQTAQEQRTMTAEAVGRTQTAQAQLALSAISLSPSATVGANQEIVSNDQILSAGDLQYGYSGLSKVASGSYGGARPSRGRYLIVLATVSNIGDEPLQLRDGFFVVKDAQGRVYDFNRATSVDFFNRYEGFGDYRADAVIAPGVPLGSVPLLFDVSSDATNLVMFSRENTNQGFLVREDVK